MEEELADGHGLNGKAFHESGSSLGWKYSSIVSEAVVSLPRAEMLPKLQDEYGLERRLLLKREACVCSSLSLHAEAACCFQSSHGSGSWWMTVLFRFFSPSLRILETPEGYVVVR